MAKIIKAIQGAATIATSAPHPAPATPVVHDVGESEQFVKDDLRHPINAAGDDETAARSAPPHQFNLDDFAAAGQQQLRDAHDRAQRILEDANRRAEEILQDAEARGYETGMRRAQQTAAQELQEGVDQAWSRNCVQLQATLQQFQVSQQQWMDHYATTVVELVTAASEQIVKHRLEHEPEILLRWASDAIAAAGSARSITIAVHPETIARMGRELEELLRTPGLPEQTMIVPDMHVDPNGVIVRQEHGQIDAQLKTQLQRLAQLLRESS
ncbi:MAG: FliH/SctL family protein [Planctomycetota bacterium]